MNHAIRHHYQKARAHQMETFGCSVTTYPSGRTELTGGSAAYGCHAEAALACARSAIAFRIDLSRRIKRDKKRSQAAKKGWKTRRAAAQ